MKHVLITFDAHRREKRVNMTSESEGEMAEGFTRDVERTQAIASTASEGDGLCGARGRGSRRGRRGTERRRRRNGRKIERRRGRRGEGEGEAGLESLKGKEEEGR